MARETTISPSAAGVSMMDTEAGVIVSVLALASFGSAYRCT